MRRALQVALTVMTLLSVAVPQETGLSSDLASLVAAERAFAGASVRKGVRASFIEYFADDGINFTPHPVNAKESFRKRPAPTKPQPFTLNWEPIYADVSRAGDLGYTTGPAVITDITPENKPPQYLFYFSIWKRQADGAWKVLVDFGISTPAPADPSQKAVFQAARRTGWKSGKGKDDSEAGRSGLANREREMSKLSEGEGEGEAYRHYLLDEARLHRDGMMPVVEKGAILAYLKRNGPRRVSFETIGSGVAQTDDLGYTYGKYEVGGQAAAGSGLEKGYFVRVWKRDASGKWKIVADIANPLPPDPK